MEKDLKSINLEFEEFLKTLPNDFDKNKIQKAFHFAKKAHIFQKRKTGEPFISHPLEVAKIVAELGLDETSIISALLHDVVEDTEISNELVKKEFGNEVETLVDGLTKITTFGRKKEDINIDALRKILLASSKDIRILIIKLCDRLHNMRTIKELPEEKQRRISNETLNIYVPIAQKVGIYSLKWELEDLALKYQDPEVYKFIKEKIKLKREQREDIVKKAVEEIKNTLEIQNIKTIVLGRPKNFYSIYKKIKDKTKEFDEIHDLYAIRILTKNIAECYTVLGAIHENYQAFPDTLKDYIANPKANGYQSIHTVIYSRSIKCPVEIQIRTEEMHKLAEFGIAAHWRYKNLNEDKKFDRKIAWLREVLLWEKEHEDNQEFLKLLKYDFFENEIFVFTPKNEVILLPEGATALDFAYTIHTDIGSKAFKAKINGLMTTIDKPIKSGDIIEIITHKSVKPSEKWLRIVQTSKAKAKIRNSLNLRHSGKQNREEEEESFEKLKSKITRLDEFKKVRKAGCCKFAYKDQIIGIAIKGGEIVVHNLECENAKYTLNPKIQLRWIEEKEKEITINLIMKDKIGLMIDILDIFSSMNLNIMTINSKTLKNGDVNMKITLLNTPQLPTLIQNLKKHEAITYAKESKGGFFG